MRLIGFEWRLREVMAAAGMFSTTKLVPLLEERGVYLSTSQVYRLAAEKPERMNMQALVALLDIFDCTFEELAPRVVLGGAAAATGTADPGPERGDSATNRLRESGLKSRRAQILPPDA
ncbi:helix-turn-helix transcriptional regulator [Micrococcus luteus]|nr:helix-turn-helix transcriptional regulator [Micrococcus luteus]